jgi:hypothetical protein
VSDPANHEASIPAAEPAQADATERVEATEVEAGTHPDDSPADPRTTEPATDADEPTAAATDEPSAATPADTEAAPAADAAVPAAEGTEPSAAAAEDAEPAASEPEDATAAPEPDGTAATPEPDGTAAEAPAARPASGPTPAPRPGPRPKPSAVPHPPRKPAPTGAPGATPAAVPDVPAVPALADDSAAAKAAAGFGRVDADGTVYVREEAGERVVGQFPGVDPDEALTLYVRRYLDLQAKVTLFESRLAASDLSVREIDQTLSRLGEETAEPSAVGDLDALRAQVAHLRTLASERRSQIESERASAKATAVAARTEIIEAAEKIAATDPARMQWRPAGEELRNLLERWKEAQRSGPRIDRASEEVLWKRFSHARTAFDRERRHYFAELEQRNAAAKTAKEKLVEEAEALSSSTDWGPTAGAYRDLMARWKAAGRASRKDDDALWARFRAAQDAFFQARDAASSATDAEYAANLEVKEALLAEAEALVPVRDLAAAKNALRDIQERWEGAGRVPRGDLQRVEGRLRAVENAVRDADQAQWTRTNPETRARAEGAAAQLESAIAGLESDLASARDRGDSRAVSELETALAARRAWLEQVARAAEDSRG